MKQGLWLRWTMEGLGFGHMFKATVVDARMMLLRGDLVELRVPTTMSAGRKGHGGGCRGSEDFPR